MRRLTLTLRSIPTQCAIHFVFFLCCREAKEAVVVPFCHLLPRAVRALKVDPPSAPHTVFRLDLFLRFAGAGRRNRAGSEADHVPRLLRARVLRGDVDDVRRRTTRLLCGHSWPRL